MLSWRIEAHETVRSVRGQSGQSTGSLRWGRRSSLAGSTGWYAKPQVEFPKFLSAVSWLGAFGPEGAEAALRERADRLRASLLEDVLGGVLIRPDGYVAWVGDRATLNSALETWTGP